MGHVAAHRPSSGHCQQWWELGAAGSQEHGPGRVTGIPAPSRAVGSRSFARRHFPGRDVPTCNPSPFLCADLLTRSRFSRGSQALIPIKTFNLEPAVAQPARYSSRRRAPGGPPTGVGSREVPAKLASGAMALGVGRSGSGSFWSCCFQDDGEEHLLARLHHRGLYPGGFTIPMEGGPRAGAAQPAGREGLHRGAEGARPPAARC